jgi:hypothetical protein
VRTRRCESDTGHPPCHSWAETTSSRIEGDNGLAPDAWNPATDTKAVSVTCTRSRIAEIMPGRAVPSRGAHPSGASFLRANPGRVLVLIQQQRYRYELRSGNATIATGHLTQPGALDVGDRIEIAGSAGIVRAVEPILGEHELRLVVQLVSTIDNRET